MVSLTESNSPLPLNCPQQPNDQFLAVGGLKHSISAALQFHIAQFAAFQPANAFLYPRLHRLIALPSMRTLSNNTPEAQLSIGPLSSSAFCASHCTNAFGP